MYKKRAAVKRPRRKATRKPKVSKSVRSYVKKTLHTNIENKTASYSLSFNITDYATQTNSLSPFVLSPYTSWTAIGQGVQQGQRLGNQIMTRKAILRYVITTNPYNISSNPYPAPQIVKMWFGYQKNKPLENVANQTSFFQNGSGSITPTGGLSDLVRPINQDLFKIYTSRTFKLGYSNYGGSGTNPANQSFSNNDYKFNHVGSIDVTKYMQKLVKFNDSVDTPTNGHILVCYMEAIRADGVTPNTAAPVNCTFMMDYTYEDA